MLCDSLISRSFEISFLATTVFINRKFAQLFAVHAAVHQDQRLPQRLDQVHAIWPRLRLSVVSIPLLSDLSFH